MRRILPPILLLIVAGCSSKPINNPAPVTVRGSPVEVTYRVPSEVVLAKPDAAPTRVVGVLTAKGILLERRGDTVTVAVSSAVDAQGNPLSVGEGGMLRVTPADSATVHRPLSKQRAIERLVLVPLLVLFLLWFLLRNGPEGGT